MYKLPKNILPNYKNEKDTINSKTNKTGKKIGTTYCLGCKDFTYNFRSQEVNMANEVLREKSSSVNCQSNKSSFLKQKHYNKKIIWHFTDLCYKKKIKTYCVKCKKILKTLTQKWF